jgi:hypothetical protein
MVWLGERIFCLVGVRRRLYMMTEWPWLEADIAIHTDSFLRLPDDQEIRRAIRSICVMQSQPERRTLFLMTTRSTD